MKKSKLKRLLALALSLGLIATTAACGKDNTVGQEENETDEQQETSEVSESEEGSQQESEETQMDTSPITLTWFVSEGDMTLGDGIHTDEVPVLQYIKDVTGVEIDWVTYNGDKYSVVVAGGDLPDIVEVNGVPTELINSGSIIPLNDLLAEYGENIEKKCEIGLKAARALYGGEEEEAYIMPILVQGLNDEIPNTNAEGGLKVRYDIYKAIGSPSMETEDDLLEVLKEMQEYERARTGEDDIYALNMLFASGWYTLSNHSRMYGYAEGTTGCHYDVETGEQVFYCEEKSPMWKALEFYNKAWRMGILDPESFTMDLSTWYDKIGTGKVLATVTWDDVYSDVCGDTAIMTLLSEPYDHLPGVYFDPSPAGLVKQQTRAISSNCENPERVMQFLNWLDSDDGLRTIYNGVPGVDWDYIDGVPQYIGDALAAFEAGEGGAYLADRTMRGCRFVYYMASGNGVETDDGYPVRLDQTLEIRESGATTAQKAFGADYGEGLYYPGQVYDKWIEEGLVTTNTNEEVALAAAFVVALDDEEIEPLVDPFFYMYNNMADIVMAETEEEFLEWKDTILQMCEENDIEKAMTILDQHVADAEALVASMFEE